MDRDLTAFCEIAEDGHPCEAALAFRQLAVRSGAAVEVPAIALDLATQFAWVGKAVSRTTDCPAWLVRGIDPNTYQFVSALAVDEDSRRAALAQAKTASPLKGFELPLARLRASPPFVHAASVLEGICARRGSEHLVVLERIAKRLPESTSPSARRIGAAVVDLHKYRQRKRRE